MKIRRLFIMLFIVLIGSSAFIFLRRSNMLPVGDELKSRSRGVPVSRLDKVSRVALHPLAANWKTVGDVEKQPVLSWEDWVQRGVEVSLAEDVMYGYINTSEELEEAREKKLSQRTQWAAKCQSRGSIFPDTLFGIPQVAPDKLFDYEGPQTAEALIAEYDQRWINTSSQSVRDWDAHYPKAAWIDRIVSMGGEFQEMRDYDFYLKLRRDLIKHKETPEKWHSGAFGIPPTTNFEAYESAYISRKIWENQMRKKVRSDYPNEPRITTFFPSSQPDKYLPVVGNMTYVYRNPNSSGMKTYGTLLTPKQITNLRNKGIEPEGVEVVYIDDEYNVLTEKPKPYDHEEWLKNNTYDHVPEGLRAPDGTIVSSERYQEITGQEMSYEMRLKYDEYIGATTSAVDPAAEFARAAAEHEAARTREVARVEFERFQNEMRHTEKFESLAASEMSQALASQFLSQYAPKSATDKRLQTALQTMFQHGFEDGLRRLRKDDSALAAELERQLAEAYSPPKPQRQRQNTLPPKPPETPPATETE